MAKKVTSKKRTVARGKVTKKKKKVTKKTVSKVGSKIKGAKKVNYETTRPEFYNDPETLNGAELLGELKNLSGGAVSARLRVHVSATNHVLEVIEAGGEFDWNSSPLSFEGKRVSDDKIVEVGELANNTVLRDGVYISALQLPVGPITVGSIKTKVVRFSRFANLYFKQSIIADLGKFKLHIVPKKSKHRLHDALRINNAITEICISGKPDSMEEYDAVLCDVLRLIGVMLSTSVYTFSKHYMYDDESTREIYEFNSGIISKPSKTVFLPRNFLEETYPAWRDMDPKVKQSMYVGATHLGQSQDTFLDTGLFSINQAWEMFATVYRKRVLKKEERYKQQESANKQKFSVLKACMEDAYNDWKERHDKEGDLQEIFDISTLIDKQLRPITLASAVEDVLSATGFNLTRVPFDERKLIRKANNVRHTGMLRGSDTINDEARLYDISKFSIELVFFKILGYKGKVIDLLGEHQNVHDVNSYFNE